ncbi:hypothetical protein V8C86DRAFT_2529551 [Haematococcus lacustris]
MQLHLSRARCVARPLGTLTGRIRAPAGVCATVPGSAEDVPVVEPVVIPPPSTGSQYQQVLLSIPSGDSNYFNRGAGSGSGVNGSGGYGSGGGRPNRPGSSGSGPGRPDGRLGRRGWPALPSLLSLAWAASVYLLASSAFSCLRWLWLQAHQASSRQQQAGSTRQPLGSAQQQPRSTHSGGSTPLDDTEASDPDELCMECVEVHEGLSPPQTSSSSSNSSNRGKVWLQGWWRRLSCLSRRHIWTCFAAMKEGRSVRQLVRVAARFPDQLQ